MVLGGSLSYALPAWGLTLSRFARGLLVHEYDAFTEWGAGGSLRLHPRVPGRGIALSLEPSGATADDNGGAAVLPIDYAAGNGRQATRAAHRTARRARRTLCQGPRCL